MRRKVDSGTAYLLWFLWLFGLGGVQRLYTGQIAVGIVYLLTWGGLGIGQLVDLALIPRMVDERNLYLKRLHGSGSANDVHPIGLNIGDISNLQPLQVQRLASNTSLSPMQKLLKIAQEQGGQLSAAQVALYTGFEPKQVKALLEEALRAGYAEISNDPGTGAIRYYFDV